MIFHVVIINKLGKVSILKIQLIERLFNYRVDCVLKTNQNFCIFVRFCKESKKLGFGKQLS